MTHVCFFTKPPPFEYMNTDQRKHVSFFEEFVRNLEAAGYKRVEATKCLDEGEFAIKHAGQADNNLRTFILVCADHAYHDSEFAFDSLTGALISYKHYP